MNERSVTAGQLSELSCGHLSPWISEDGHVYGPAEPGSWVSCSIPPCQTQRKVIRVIPVIPMSSMDGTSWPDFCEHFNSKHPYSDAGTLPGRQLGPDVQLAYRRFHDRLHIELRDLDHEHSPV